MKRNKAIYLLCGLLIVHTIASIFDSLQISKAIASFFVLYSLYIIISNFNSIRKPCTLVLVYSTLVMLSNIINYQSSYDFFISVIESLWWPSVFILFYFKIRDEKSCRVVMGTINCLLLINLVSVAYIAFNLFLLKGEISAFNYIYYAVCLVPFVSFIKSPVRKVVLLLIIALLVVISMKRTALIVIMVQIVISSLFIIKGTKNMILGFVALTFIAIISVWGLQKIEEVTYYNAFSRFEMIQEDGGSGRAFIWMQVRQSYSSFDFFEKLLGHGHNAVRKDGLVHGLFASEDNISAHNDYLEMLYDHGFLTLFVYVLILITMIKLTVLLGRQGPTHIFELMLRTVFTILIISMTSHLVLYPSYYAYLIIAWVIANFRKSCNAWKLVRR